MTMYPMDDWLFVSGILAVNFFPLAIFKGVVTRKNLHGIDLLSLSSLSLRITLFYLYGSGTMNRRCRESPYQFFYLNMGKLKYLLLVG